MAKGRHLLTARIVTTIKGAGRYADGDGLYLIVRDRGRGLEKTWLYRYRRGGRGDNREMTVGLGPARTVTLAAARDMATLCRQAVQQGTCPKAALASRNPVPTFGAVADDLVASLTAGFSNDKHIAQWKMTLGDAYCGKIRPKPVDRVTTEDVLDTLKPIWQSKPETAARLRGRIERVLDSAKVAGHRSGENPARWRGHLSLLLPRQGAQLRGHFRAMAWRDVPDFMTRLRERESISAAALEWTILTVARTNETVYCQPSEIDRAAAVWTIPAARMKMRREHRIPLCDRALALYDEMSKLGGDWLFPGRSLRDPLSTAAMSECLKQFGVDATVHGFRSSFRDWAGEATGYPEEHVELCLAHVTGSKTKRAYRREDALEQRRAIMAAWERYLYPVTNVVRFVLPNQGVRS